MNLSGSVVLVTGAGKRVGRAIAEGFGARGASVAVHYNASADGANETADRIKALGGNARVVQGDLTRTESAALLVNAVVGEFGAIDVLVNSAAIMEQTPFESVDEADWERIMALNLRAPYFLSVAAAEAMRATRGNGVIVNIGDLAARETWPGYSVHGISKAGVHAMTRILARQMAPSVRVNCVVPGAVLLPEDWPEEDAAKLVRTTPLRRIGTPADVVEAVLYLASADFVTGAALVVDGGRDVRH